jgi:excisionase family DNA binding protein
MARQLLTAAEVADQLRVSTMTIYRLIRSGELPAVRVGRNYRVRAEDLTAYLEGQVVDPDTMDLDALDDLDEGGSHTHAGA